MSRELRDMADCLYEGIDVLGVEVDRVKAIEQTAEIERDPEAWVQ